MSDGWVYHQNRNLEPIEKIFNSAGWRRLYCYRMAFIKPIPFKIKEWDACLILISYRKNGTCPRFSLVKYLKKSQVEKSVSFEEFCKYLSEEDKDLILYNMDLFFK